MAEITAYASSETFWVAVGSIATALTLFFGIWVHHQGKHKGKISQDTLSQGRLQPGQQQDRPVFHANPTSNIEAIRFANRVRPLRPLEEGLALRKLPNGVFGFTTPWAPRCYSGNISVEHVTLHAEKGGTFRLEIHKSSAGGAFIVGFVSQSGQHILDDPSQVQAFDVQIFCDPYEEFVYPAAIPLKRIESCDNRTVGLFKKSPGELLDLKIKPIGGVN